MPTSQGDVSIPQLDGQLTLGPRDSKIHVTDYDLGGINLLYSSAEIFTWKSYGDRTVLVVYGGPGERHELAVSDGGEASVIEGEGIQTGNKNGTTVLNWETTSSRKVVQLSNGLHIYILDRNTAYNYWTLKLPDERGLFAPNVLGDVVILQAGYLMRNATISDRCLYLIGDFNATTDIEVIGGAPAGLADLYVNGESAEFEQNDDGVVTTSVAFNPDISVPSLADLDWKYIDSLPEVQPGYDDSAWPRADLAYSNNTRYNLSTPTSLFGADYGFSTGVLVYRGHFTATGQETELFLETQGGSAFGTSVWVNSEFAGSFDGYDAAANGNMTYTLPNLKAGSDTVITVVIDETGINQNYVVREDQMKDPRGILRYQLAGHNQTDVTWKLTGNYLGEDYPDKVRGPLNEGGLYAERQGYHLPGAPISDWESSGGPTEGISSAGVAFYGAEIDLDIPAGWDVPLSFTFTNSSSADAAGSSAPSYRVQLYVNGYQFGKYVNNIGPQTSYPVPQGIWDYSGTNYIAFALWSLEAGGAKVEGLELSVNATVLSGYGDVPMSLMSSWSQRDAY